jgi:hypothetical protein
VICEDLATCLVTRSASWPAFRIDPWSHAPFFGVEPIGNCAIHIIVNHGVVSLYGTLSSEVDRVLSHPFAYEAAARVRVLLGPPTSACPRSF